MKTPEEFENQLRAALRREPPPPDFAAKVLARTNSNRGNKRYWMPLAAALLAGAVIPAVVVERHRHEQALEARRQLVSALQITRAKLNFAKEKIQRKHL